MQYIDQIAGRLSLGDAAPPTARRELHTVLETLRQLHQQDSAEYERAVLEAFDNVPAPHVSEMQVQRKLSKPRLPHPGRVVKEVMVQRGLTMEALAQAMRFALPEVQQLLDEKAPITDSIANALARGLGRSPRDWLTLQKDFDKQQAASQQKKPHA